MDAAARQRRASRYIREHHTLIMLHYLYQRWGLPTRLLEPLMPGKVYRVTPKRKGR